jgi:hypothetical protein
VSQTETGDPVAPASERQVPTEQNAPGSHLRRHLFPHPAVWPAAQVICAHANPAPQPASAVHDLLHVPQPISLSHEGVVGPWHSPSTH